MKKLAIAALAATMLSSANASSCANAFSGFYAGVQAGLSNTTGDLNISNYYADPANAAAGTPSNFKGNSGKNSFLGGLFGGYGMGVGSCTYVGGEMYLNFASANNTLFNAANSLLIKSKNSYSLGAKVRLGYTVSQQAMIFVGLGMQYSKPKLTVTNQANAQTAAAVKSSLVNSKNKKQLSPAISTGMDMFVNKNLFIRGEYTYVVGKSQNVNAPMNNAGGTVSTATVKAKLTQQLFVLGLGYKF